jgi:4-diphosphocytidyl-2-C-methyl-D-erythritol kinase
MQIKAYAKINLCLDVLKKEKGFHRIRTVFQQIDLHDTLTIKETDDGKITVECDEAALSDGGLNEPRIPTDRRNTAYKAAVLMRKIAHTKKGLLIKIQKRIPSASGLGGASSDAAAVLNALNRTWKLELTPSRLRIIAAKIGMDVPFFIMGGTALGTHYGEKITQVPPLELPPFLIAVNGHKNSTAEMYRLLDLKKSGRKKALTDSLIGAAPGITSRSAMRANLPASRATSPCACRLFHNDFEAVLAHRHMASTRELFKTLLRSGATVVHISGSGPAICSFYKNQKELTRAYKSLLGKVKFLWKADGRKRSKN